MAVTALTLVFTHPEHLELVDESVTDSYPQGIAHNIMVNGFRNADLSRAKALFVRPGMPYKNIDIHNNIILQDNGGTIAEVSSDNEVNIYNNLWSHSPPGSAARCLSVGVSLAHALCWRTRTIFRG